MPNLRGYIYRIGEIMNKNIEIQKLLLDMLSSYIKLLQVDNPDSKALTDALVVNYAAKIEFLMKGEYYGKTS